MTHKDRIVAFVSQFPSCDDDEIAKALRIQPRQTVNQICRLLEKERVICRRRGITGKIANFPTDPTVRSEPARPVKRSDAAVPAPRVVHSACGWFWEGNVADALAEHLRKAGWSIVSQADTASKQRGVDIHARRDRQELLVEVKGYPSSAYNDPKRADEVKPTSPSLQAGHWYSHALLKAIRLRCASEALVMMAFPDFPRFRTLYEQTEWALNHLEIVTAFLAEDGAVEFRGRQADKI